MSLKFSSSIIEINEEEENKYELDGLELSSYPRNAHTKKASPRNILSQYIDCQQGHEVKSCKPMSRIIDLLMYCQQNRSKSINIYQYLMESYQNYDISSVMEDWHQIKINHGQDHVFNEWIVNNKTIYCNEQQQCASIQRYQRDRESQQYTPHMDLKNTILMDKIDSIHTWLFHTLPQRQSTTPFKNIQYNNEENENENPSDQTNICSDFPDDVKDCSTNQIMSIVADHLFDSLKESMAKKLINYKNNIIEYIKINQINGDKLLQMNRKHFVSELMKYLELTNNKLKAPLAAVHTRIIRYNLTKNNTDSKQIRNVKNTNSKFITNPNPKQYTESIPKYYSFGVQYKYTSDIKDHPFYIAPKYNDIKEEMIEYLLLINGETDKTELVTKQIKSIAKIKLPFKTDEFQRILTQSITTQHFDGIGLLWDDEDIDEKDDVVTRFNNRLKDIIANLFTFVNKKEVYSKIDSFTKKTIYDFYENTISYDLKKYFEALADDNPDILDEWEQKSGEQIRKYMKKKSA
eukprot:501592_1